MNTHPLSLSADADEEVAALIATLHATGQRLEELTGGEVDAVADHEGRPFVLQRAQNRLRHHEAEKQAAILNALPTNIALIDAGGVIVAVNAAWRLFGDSNGSQSPGHEIGVDYLAVCDRSAGGDAPLAREAAAGLRAVLAGTARRFSIEYPCDSPAIKRWFVLTASPVAEDCLHGAVVMHMEITEKVLAEAALRKSLEDFRSLAESMPQIVWTTGPDGRTTYFNQRWMDYTGLSLEESLGSRWSRPFHPDDRQCAWDAWQRATATVGTYSLESRLRRADGVYRWWLVRGVPLKDAGGAILKWFGTCTDIHDLKESKLEIERANASLRASAARIAYLSRVHGLRNGINQLIAHASDRRQLFQQTCQIAVEQGGFHTAVLVIADRDSTRLVAVASAGNDETLLTEIRNALLPYDPASDMVVATAIREKRSIVSNNASADSRLHLRRAYEEAWVHSVATCPLIVTGEAIGALLLFATESDFFHSEEMALVATVTEDIAFAIDHIDQRDRLNHVSWHDPLTGLANRSLFLERVAQCMRNASSAGCKLAVGLIDLERFKNINDSLGQLAGDALLKQVAEWLSRTVGDDGLVARVEADHFAIVLPEIRPGGDVPRLLDKMIDAFLAHPFRLNDAVFRIGAKGGVALFPDDGDSADVLFKYAEAALKQAKAHGDRYLFYTQAMTDRAAGKPTLENQLRQAIDNEEFVLHYQPKVNLVSGLLVGAEALIRWNDPRTGLVPPFKFIPILEETGLIQQVGRWAMRKAIEDYLRWRGAGLPAVRIAVNVSALQLRSRGFIDEVQQAIAIDARAAAGLELEITESMIMEDIKQGIASLRAIRALGVSIAIDDFGTGFSSLGYLSKLPIDTLKIDRSFIVDMTTGPNGLSLVSTIINLAHALQLKVVGEGVETEEQSRLLRLLGCDEMQGYLFSKPVPGEIFEAKFLAPPTAVA